MVMSQIAGLELNNEADKNEASFYSVYLQTIAKGISPNPYDFVALYKIGKQCPTTGGAVVYWERNLYTLLTHHDIKTDDCSDAHNRAQEDVHSVRYSTQEVAISPNPATDILQVSLLDIPLNETTLEIMDVTGRIIKSSIIKSDNSQISIQDLKQGLYFISVIENGHVIFTSKLVKL
jgi:hypothetical protein